MIASGTISFRNNRVRALDLCPKCIFGQYLRMNSRISITFCICIDIYIYDLHLSNYILLRISIKFCICIAKTLVSERSGMELQVG